MVKEVVKVVSVLEVEKIVDVNLIDFDNELFDYKCWWFVKVKFLKFLLWILVWGLEIDFGWCM